jgi:hypothetical protein
MIVIISRGRLRTAVMVANSRLGWSTHIPFITELSVTAYFHHHHPYIINITNIAYTKPCAPDTILDQLNATHNFKTYFFEYFLLFFVWYTFYIHSGSGVGFTTVLLGLFLHPENGGDVFLRNVCWFSTDYTALKTQPQLLHINFIYSNIRLVKWVVILSIAP